MTRNNGFKIVLQNKKYLNYIRIASRNILDISYTYNNGFLAVLNIS